MVTLLLFSISGTAQTEEVIYLWPDTVPGETEVKHAPLQTKDTTGNVIRLTNVTNPSMTVFKPDSLNNNETGIIVCPGGGYTILAANLEGTEIAAWLTTLGYTVFVLHYRVPRKEKGALQDIQRALRIVRSRSDHFGMNPDQIGVLGFSAGGSLSARASTRFTEETYTKIDEIDTFSSRPDFSMLIYPAYLDGGPKKSITPELTITKDTPPFFIFATADDHHGNSALVMAGALRDAKAPVDLHFLSKGGHGYGLRKGNSAAETWTILAEKWLKGLTE